MNIMFWVLILIACVVLWFLLAPLFKKIGDKTSKVIDGAIDEIKEETKEEKNE